MAKLLKTSGEVVLNVDISTLKQMQELVGGYIELCYLKSGEILVVNEEGLLNQLPHNEQASELQGHPLVGDVILCGASELN